MKTTKFAAVLGSVVILAVSTLVAPAAKADDPPTDMGCSASVYSGELVTEGLPKEFVFSAPVRNSKETFIGATDYGGSVFSDAGITIDDSKGNAVDLFDWESPVVSPQDTIWSLDSYFYVAGRTYHTDPYSFASDYGTAICYFAKSTFVVKSAATNMGILRSRTGSRITLVATTGFYSLPKDGYYARSLPFQLLGKVGSGFVVLQSGKTNSKGKIALRVNNPNKRAYILRILATPQTAQYQTASFIE